MNSPALSNQPFDGQHDYTGTTMPSPALSALGIQGRQKRKAAPSVSDNLNMNSNASIRSPSPSPAALIGGRIDPRYPPFDPEDPLASLSDLRRRSWNVLQNPSPYSEEPKTPTGASPDISQRASMYLLTTDQPSASGSKIRCPFQSSSKSTHSAIGVSHYSHGLHGHEATSHSIQGEGKYSYHGLHKEQSKSSVSLLNHHRHHNQSLLSLPDLLTNRARRKRVSSTSSSSSTHSSVTVTVRSRFRKPSKALQFLSRKSSLQNLLSSIPSRRSYSFSTSRTATPPLTPDDSDTSSGSREFHSRSLHDRMSRQTSSGPQLLKRPAANFVKKLLPKRSGLNSNTTSSKKRPTRESPSSLSSPSPIPDEPPCLPFPRSTSTLADSILNSPTLTLINPPSNSPPRHQRRHSTSPLEAYAPVNERSRETITDGEDSDFPDLPSGGRRIRLFSFNSRSLLRTRVDIVELGKEAPAKQAFEEYGTPSIQQVYAAAARHVVAESGVRVRFGELIENGRCIVIFIRHFRCTSCQDYVRSISEEIDIPSLERAGLRFIIVGVGAPSMITPYRQLTNTRIPIYTDPTLSIHRILGMTLRTTDPGPESERGHYVHHTTIGGIRRTLADLMTNRLPAFEKGGDIAQLGGEFVFGPGLQCLFAHRMKNTRSHLPITAVIGAAGFDIAQTSGASRTLALLAERSSKRGSWNSVEDEEAWMARRRRSLARLKEKRNARRLGAKGGCGCGSGIQEVIRGSSPIVEENGEVEGEFGERGRRSDTKGIRGRVSNTALRSRGPSLKLAV